MRSRGPLAAALAMLVALAPALAAPALAHRPPAAPPRRRRRRRRRAQGRHRRRRRRGQHARATGARATRSTPRRSSTRRTSSRSTARTRRGPRSRPRRRAPACSSTSATATASRARTGQILSPSVQDGMGINEIGGVERLGPKYYGESLIASDIRFAKNAVVLLTGPVLRGRQLRERRPRSRPSPSRSERIDNFASGWIKAGARVVISDIVVSSVVYDIAKIFTTNQSFGQVWNNAPNRHGQRAGVHPVPEPAVRRSRGPGERLLPLVRGRDGHDDHRRPGRRHGRGHQRRGHDHRHRRAGAVVRGRAAQPRAELRWQGGQAQPAGPLLRDRDLVRGAEERGRRRRAHADRDRAPAEPHLGPQGRRRRRARRRVHVEPHGEGRGGQCRGGRRADRSPITAKADARHRRPVLRA